MDKRPTEQQISLFISLELHKILKQKALDRNIKMKDYIIQAILKRVEEEKTHE